MTHDSDILDLATACGDRLLQTAMEADQGLSWRAPDGRVYTGFAHGVAGIAYALGRLFDATGERRFGRASADGYRYVASRYVDAAQNWPVLGEPVEGVAGLGPSMTAWCHGAPGVTLAISLGSADTVYAKLLDQLEPSLKTTAGASPHMADHLCCGNMGRCESLFTTGRRLMRREAVEGSRRLARVVIARARKAGHFCLAANGFEYRYLRPRLLPGCVGDRLYPAAPGGAFQPAVRRRLRSAALQRAAHAIPSACKEIQRSMRRSAVLSLALLVALPAVGGVRRSSPFPRSRASGSRTRRRRCRRRA